MLVRGLGSETVFAMLCLSPPPVVMWFVHTIYVYELTRLWAIEPAATVLHVGAAELVEALKRPPARRLQVERESPDVCATACERRRDGLTAHTSYVYLMVYAASGGRYLDRMVACRMAYALEQVDDLLLQVAFVRAEPARAAFAADFTDGQVRAELVAIRQPRFPAYQVVIHCSS